MEQEMYSVILAQRADSILLSHAEFLARVSPAIARSLLSEFKAVINKLSKDPSQFPLADEIDVPGILPGKYRKCMFADFYKALFQVKDSFIYVDAIIDCRQESINIF